MLKHKKTNTLTSNKQKEENSSFPVDKPADITPTEWWRLSSSVIIHVDIMYPDVILWKGCFTLWHFPKPQTPGWSWENRKIHIEGHSQNIWPEPFKSIKVMEENRQELS